MGSGSVVGATMTPSSSSYAHKKWHCLLEWTSTDYDTYTAITITVTFVTDHASNWGQVGNYLRGDGYVNGTKGINFTGSSWTVYSGEDKVIGTYTGYIDRTSSAQSIAISGSVWITANSAYDVDNGTGKSTASTTVTVPALASGTGSGRGNVNTYTQSSYTLNWCTYVTYKITSTTETAVNYTATVAILHNNTDTSKHVNLSTGITATLSVGGTQVQSYTSTAAHELYAGLGNAWTVITYSGSIARTTAAQTKAISASVKLTNWGSGTSTYTNNSAFSIPAKNKYTLTFNANGHGTAPTAQSVYYGTTATQPTNPTVTGWTFGGWYNEAACTSAFSFSTTITANKTIYAKWTAQTSAVTLNANGGSGGTASVTATYDSAMPSMTKPSFSGWTFQGYYDTSAATGGTQYYTAAGASARVWNKTGAQTLYARWSRTITFKHGKANASSGTTTQYKGGNITPPTITAVSGWTAIGWRDDTSGGNKEYGANNTTAFAYTGTATTLYAAYSRTLTLSYTNGGGSGTAPSNTTATQYYNANGATSSASFTLATNTFTAPSGGYSFSKWGAGNASASWSWNPGVDAGVSTSTAAVWTRTITFKHGKANATTSTATQTYNSTVTPPTITAISGWTPLGWRDDTSAGAKEYGANNTTAFSYTGTTQTLYATYSRTLTISYASGDGTGTNPSNTTTTQYYNANGAITSPAVTLATNPYSKTGYSFNVWNVSVSNTNVASGGSYTWSIAVDVTTISRTATAQWTIISYTLTIDPNGGSWGGTTSVSTASQNYNTTKSIAVPTRAGYTFVGWAETGNGRLSKINQADPAFDSSSGGVAIYNNSGGGTVTHTRQSSGAGTAYGSYEILISSSSGTTSPGNGGFYQPTTSAASQKYIHVFVAKIPVGYTVQHAENATGDGRTIQWLTSRKGTGAYQVYAYQHNCGSSGTFSTFGHVYLDTGSRPVSWQLAYSAMTNITNGFADTYTYGAGAGRLTALWAPIVPVHVNINGTWKTGPVWLNINGTWKQAIEGYVNINGTWKQIK